MILSLCTSAGQNWLSPCTAELYTVSLFGLSAINRLQRNDKLITGQGHLSGNDALIGDSLQKVNL